MRRLVRGVKRWISRPLIVWLVYAVASHMDMQPDELAEIIVQGIQDTYMGGYGDEAMEILEEILCNEFGVSVEIAEFGYLVARRAG